MTKDQSPDDSTDSPQQGVDAATWQQRFETVRREDYRYRLIATALSTAGCLLYSAGVVLPALGFSVPRPGIFYLGAFFLLCGITGQYLAARLNDRRRALWFGKRGQGDHQ